MRSLMTCQIESVDFNELLDYMRFQADEAFPSLKDEQWLQAFTTKLHTNAEFSLCRNGERQLIGMIAFYANGRGANFAYIPHVYVSPEYRHQGLFTTMLNLVKEYVKQKGFKEMRLEVNNDNEPAQRSYLKNGFRVIESSVGGDKSLFMRLII